MIHPKCYKYGRTVWTDYILFIKMV